MTAQEETTTAREPQPARYAISENAANELRRNLSLVAYARQCYMCQQEMEIEESASVDLSDFMERISEHCAEEPDYLLPDTPVKEAVFRFLLARRNKPATVEEISDELSRRWAMTHFPKPTSPPVMRRLLSGVRDYYCIEAVEG